jgi:hypothetical protein
MSRNVLLDQLPEEFTADIKELAWRSRRTIRQTLLDLIDREVEKKLKHERKSARGMAR